MLDFLRKAYDVLGRQARNQALLVFALVLIMAVVEMLGVASIMPFIALLSNPSVLDTNRYLSAAYRGLGFGSTDAFLIFVGVATLVLLVGSVVLRAITLWFQLRFINMQTHIVGSRLVEHYLRQPYEWFLRHSSSDIGANVLAEVTNVLQGAVYSFMLLFANGVVAMFLMILLIAVDPVLATIVVLVLGGTYCGVFLFVKQRVGRLGSVRVRANRQRHQAVQEAFIGIKDIKVAGVESRFLDRFRGPSEHMARASITSAIITELPSFFMQVVVFGGMLLVVIYLMMARGSLQDALPIISLYALAGYRLLPSLQGAYRNVTAMRFNIPALEILHRDIHEFTRAPRVVPSQGLDFSSSRRLGLRHSLEVRDLCYQYPGTEHSALENLRMIIQANSTVALVGSTGSGKTTAVDVILGLLKPTSGQLLADGQQVVDSNVRSWQRSIGYVPQTIFLTDDTIAANIAFGVASAQVDPIAIERAARIANLHNFVLSELPHGYETEIGERGVRLSGGQRQRIGIARALYHDPDLLVFDEATSALDNVTEQAVMEAIYALARKKTVILIAHRLSTVRACDRIFLLDRGRIIAAGKYEELLSSSEAFRAMATQATHAGPSVHTSSASLGHSTS